jgi:hypothetical protein
MRGRHSTRTVIAAVALVAVVVVAAAVAFGAFDIAPEAAHHVDHLGWNGTVEPMDGGGGWGGPNRVGGGDG